MKQQWIIKDWAGNLITFKGRPHVFDSFDSFDDAEEVLCEELDEAYETDRCEYYILPRSRRR